MRLGNHQKAEQYLIELSKQQKDKVALGTGSHHLAWVLIDKSNYSQALQLAQEALHLYQNVGDIGGIADEYEQLGIIAQRLGDMKKAEYFFEQTLSIRSQLGYIKPSTIKEISN